MSAVGVGRCPGDRHAGTLLRERVDDELPADAVERLFAGPVHIGDGDRVRGRKRGGKLGREMARARIEVRLEEREQTTVRARGRERRG